jgi:hypothetical protein
MKYYIYISILLACCLSAPLPALAQSGCMPQVCEFGCSNVQVCSFDTGPGQNSAVATFDCTSIARPCPDPYAHSIKFTVGTVKRPFDITVTAIKVTGDGVCDSGKPGDPDPEPPSSLSSVDCRFVRFFGDPPYNNNPMTNPLGLPNNPPTKVPFCYHYALSVQEAACVVYSVNTALAPPPEDGGPYSGGVDYKIAWNHDVTTPDGYFTIPRMFDDPDDDDDGTDYPAISDPSGNNNVFPYQPEDQQFVFDITTGFIPHGSFVGVDQAIIGHNRSFNDFVLAFRFCTAKQDDVEGDGHEQGDDGHEGEFEFCQRSREMSFEERDTGTKMNGSMDAVILSGNQAVISGAGTLGDGTPVHYTAVVLGNAPVIGANHFVISWVTPTGLVFQTSGALTDGFIVVPPLPPL